ncbi:MAG TPA: polysaccharide biosynthesis/export family protein [Terriglobales bacterium]|nr:polysaccharide biosynthesis/export family protein [Terriglobales bacterium]
MLRVRRANICWIVVVFLLAVAKPVVSESVPPTPQSAQTDIRIGTGDLLQIKVFGVPELSEDVRVSGSGDVGMPLIGNLHLGGLTTDEASNLLESKLKEGGFLKNPEVSVFIKEYATQGVSVLGEVQKPGVYQILGPRTLFDVLSLAGGTTTRAGRNVSITHRDRPGEPVTVALSSDAAESVSANVPVMPGDTVVVSKAGVVYVVGDVAKPSGFVMENNERMTVLQAVAMAGGANTTASLDNSRVIRKGSAGIQEIPISLKKILSAKAPDEQLQPGDVLFVPRSAGKSAARRGAEAILQITTGVAVYRR